MTLSIDPSCVFTNVNKPQEGSFTGDTLTISAKDGYKITPNSNQNILLDNGWGEEFTYTPTYNEDSTQCTYNNLRYMKTGTLYGSYIGTSLSTANSILRLYSDTTLTNCYVEIDGVKMNKSDFPVTRQGSFYFYIVANDGYEFIGTNYYFITDTGTEYYVKETNQRLQGMTLTPGSYDTINGIVSISATQIPVTTLSKLVTIYFPTDNEIEQISGAGFFDVVDGYKLSDYMTKYFALPFDLAAEYSDNKSNFKLGKYDTQIPMTTALNWHTVIDGGTIEIKPKYNNVYDYKNVDCIIKAPFFEPLSINDASYIMGATLHIEYLIDLYTGYTTLKITSSLTNVPIYESTKKLSYDLPFIQIGNVSYLNQLNIPMIETVLQGSVSIKRNVPIYHNEPFGKNTIKIGTIKELNITGFARITNISLAGAMPKNLITELQSLLSSGIFI